mmetsp:Transcript_25787/g.65056  ORF Transcript_25787/g.65056 Transcript_25787/m.65056 type:complete len:111 (-) Transcript_25787:127-459(-)
MVGKRVVCDQLDTCFAHVNCRPQRVTAASLFSATEGIEEDSLPSNKNRGRVMREVKLPSGHEDDHESEEAHSVTFADMPRKQSEISASEVQVVPGSIKSPGPSLKDLKGL